MIDLLLALMFLVVIGISIKTPINWSSAFDSALTRVATVGSIESAEVWIL